MKFKDYGNGWYRLGLTTLFIKKEVEGFWSIWEMEGESLYRLKHVFRSRNHAAKYYLKNKPSERVGNPVPLPEKPIREQPHHLVSFESLLKKL